MSKTVALTYEDLVGKFVHVRLFDKAHPEWQRCEVVSIVRSGIKLKSTLNEELFVICKDDVVEDIRAEGAFIPWEREQKPYDGKWIQMCKL